MSGYAAGKHCPEGHRVSLESTEGSFGNRHRPKHNTIAGFRAIIFPHTPKHGSGKNPRLFCAGAAVASCFFLSFYVSAHGGWAMTAEKPSLWCVWLLSGY